MDERTVQVSRTHRNLLMAGAAATAVLVAIGGLVCATNASGGCPDWPRCHGRLVPPLQMNSIIEYTHRVVALISVVLVMAGAIVGWRRRESGSALRVLPTLAIAFMLAAAVFGAFAVLTGLSPLLAAIDLGCALIGLALIIAASVIGSTRFPLQPATSKSMLAVLSLVTLPAFLAVILSGVLVAQGTVMRCVGGPLHIGTWSSLDGVSWEYTLRFVLGVTAALLAAAVVAVAIHGDDVDAVTRRWSALFGVLFLIEIALNAAMVPAGSSAPLLIASEVAAVATWSALVVVASRATLFAVSRRGGIAAFEIVTT